MDQSGPCSPIVPVWRFPIPKGKHMHDERNRTSRGEPDFPARRGRDVSDYALGYAARGWRVFPLHSIQSGACSCGRKDCSSAGKHPRTRNGVKDATLDAGQIASWWATWSAANIGIATGSGLYVIDVDCAKGGTLESLLDLGITGCMWTLSAQTGSGGYHLYLSTEQALSNTAGKLAAWVDTRGEGGYVVAPPSRNQHGRYIWYNSQPMQPMPEALLARLRDPARSSSTQATTGRTRKEQTSDQARLADQKAGATQGAVVTPAAGAQSTQTALDAAASVAKEARNTYLAGMAGRFRGQGLNASEICALVVALNEARYGAGRHPQGPLSLEELKRTIFKSVARWQEECGLLASRLPEIEQLSDLMAREIPPPVWLVKGMLCEGLSVIAGKPKLGKSWLVLALALTIALGNEKGGLALGRYPVEQAGVLYLSLEDSASRFQSRVNKLLAGRPVPANFGYTLNWKPLMSGGLEDLDTYLLNAPDTRLVVIDT